MLAINFCLHVVAVSLFVWNIIYFKIEHIKYFTIGNSEYWAFDETPSEMYSGFFIESNFHEWYRLNI